MFIPWTTELLWAIYLGLLQHYNSPNGPTEEKTPLAMDEKCQVMFDCLKWAMMEECVLALLDYSNALKVETDG